MGGVSASVGGVSCRAQKGPKRQGHQALDSEPPLLRRLSSARGTRPCHLAQSCYTCHLASERPWPWLLGCPEDPGFTGLSLLRSCPTQAVLQGRGRGHRQDRHRAFAQPVFWGDLQEDVLEGSVGQRVLGREGEHTGQGRASRGASSVCQGRQQRPHRPQECGSASEKHQEPRSSG